MDIVKILNNHQEFLYTQTERNLFSVEVNENRSVNLTWLKKYEEEKQEETYITWVEWHTEVIAEKA